MLFWLNLKKLIQREEFSYSKYWNGKSRLAFIPSVLWLRLVEVCIFCLCVLSLLQVAAVYKDPSVGNLINIMIVKLIIIHNEQVSIQVSSRQCRCPWPLVCVACLKGHCQLCQGSPWETNNTVVRRQATCKWEVAEEARGLCFAMATDYQKCN